MSEPRVPSPATAPFVELLWWSGCPSHGQARELLAKKMTALGLNPDTIETYQIVTDEEAAVANFIGSPTIRVNGQDIAPPPPGTPTALTCRLYFLTDGRPSPMPDPAHVHNALTRAIGRDAAAPENQPGDQLGDRSLNGP